MIAKGNQRSGGQELATHLLNAYDNERIEIAEISGAAAGDLHGAFAEWRALASATACKKYLYSLSVNPDYRQGEFTRQQYLDFIIRVEKKLGLGGQPRAVVFHIKQGREHCHIVWSRIDIDRLTAIQLSHDRQKLRLIARAFARDHGLTLPDGLAHDRPDRFNDSDRSENLAEKQQQERSGVSKAEHMRAIAEAWQGARGGEEFVRALTAKGYYIAAGERRAYVVVDRFGAVHSLSRLLKGEATAKGLKARLANLPPESLPSVERARQHARQMLEKHQALEDERQQRARARDSEQRRVRLREAQARRRETLDARERALVQQHETERNALIGLQNAERRGLAADRQRAAPQGIFRFLARITGFQWLTDIRHGRQDQTREKAYRAQSEALARKHARECQDMGRHDKSLARVEKRERRSLETALRKEQLREVLLGERTPARERAARRLTDTFGRSTGRDRDRSDDRSLPPRHGRNARDGE